MKKENEDLKIKSSEQDEFFLFNHSSQFNKENKKETESNKIKSNFINKNIQKNNSINKLEKRYSNNINLNQKDEKVNNINSTKIVDYVPSNSSIHFSNFNLINQKTEPLINLNEIKLTNSIKNEELNKKNSMLESSNKESIIVPFDDDEYEDLSKGNNEIV